MTTSEMVWEVAGLRQKGLSDRQHKAWCTQLEDYTPEDVWKAAQRIARTWTEGYDWPIGLLLQSLPTLQGEATPFTGFAWCSVTGRARGDWNKFFALPPDERHSIARDLLRAAGTRPVDHHETAERMCPGVAL